MLHVSHFVSVKTLNTLIKRSSPHSIVTKKMYKQISSVHGSSVLTVKETAKTTEMIVSRNIYVALVWHTAAFYEKNFPFLDVFHNDILESTVTFVFLSPIFLCTIFEINSTTREELENTLTFLDTITQHFCHDNILSINYYCLKLILKGRH